MKALFLSGLALAILTGGALAQSATPTPTEATSQPAAKTTPWVAQPKGAHIRLEDGDAAVDIKCADDESMKVCADITLEILEKLVALPKPKS